MRKRKRVKFKADGYLGGFTEMVAWQFDPYIAFRLLWITIDGGRWYRTSHIPTGRSLAVDVRGLKDADWISEEISKLTDWGAITSQEDFDALPAKTIAMIKKEVKLLDQTLEMQYSGKV